MKALTLALAASTLVCAIALVWTLSAPTPPDPRLAQMESDLKAARETIAQLRKDLANRPVASAPAPRLTALNNASSNLNVAPPAPAAATPAGSTGAGALREMIKNPAMRDLLGQQAAVQIETGYARLFAQLQLTDEERAHFKNLLAERAKLEADTGLRMLDSNLSPQQRQQIIAEAERNKKAYDETIRKFLNNDADWNAFQTYEVTRPERTQYETFGRSLFTASGEPLSAQQEDQMIQVMAQARQNPSPEHAQLMKTLSNPVGMTDANLNAFVESQRVQNARAVEQASAFLSPAQLKAFQNYQEQSLQIMKQSIETGRAFLNPR